MFFLQILLNSIVLGTQILLIAVPLYLIYSVSKVFHLAVGAISTAIAYGFYRSFIGSDSVPLAIVMALLIAVGFGVLSYFLLETYIQKKQTLFALMVSFSLGAVIESLIAMVFGSDGKSIVQEVLPVFHIFGLNLTLPGFMTIMFGILFFVMSAFLVIKTPFGRILRSLSENSASFESLGTNSQYIRFLTYLIAIFMAGFVGIMSGINTSITPYMGFHTILMAFIAFLIGGTTSVTGTLIASYLVVFIPQLMISYTDFSDSWKMVFVFLLAAVLLSVRPKGLFHSAISQIDMGYLFTIICRYFETLITAPGVHLAISTAGIFFLGFPVTFASGAYTMVILQKQGFPLLAAVVISLVIAALIGLIFAFAYIKLSNDSYTLLTLASIMAFDALIKSWDSVTGGVLGIAGVARPKFFSSLLALAVGQGIVAAVILAFEYILLKTAFGRSIRAMKENKISLNSLGSSDHQLGFMIVIFVSILASVEGMFSIWRIQFLDPSFAGIIILIKMLTVVIIAYKPKVSWLALSALFVMLLPEALRFFHLSSVIMGHMRMLLYALLVIFLIRNLSGKSLQTNRSF